MSIKSFQTLKKFLAANPLRNHSSRVLSKIPLLSIAVSVADAFLRDVLSALVANATIRDVPDGPLIGFNVSSLAFAATPLGSTLDMPVVITNNGSADLMISLITSSGDFSVASVTA